MGTGVKGRTISTCASAARNKTPDAINSNSRSHGAVRGKLRVYRVGARVVMERYSFDTPKPRQVCRLSSLNPEGAVKFLEIRRPGAILYQNCRKRANTPYWWCGLLGLSTI